MIARTNNHSGFTLIEVLVMVAVVAVIGALGFTFYGRMNQVAQDSGQQRVATDVKGAPEVSQPSDLDKAAEVLDQTDPAASSSDLSQLESMSSEF